METVSVIAPIPLPILRRKFTEPDLVFEIDYANSKLQGKALITYLSNLDIKCRLKFEDPAQQKQMLIDYLYIPTLVKIGDLEWMTLQLLMQYVGLPVQVSFDTTDLFTEHAVILGQWKRRLASLYLYALWSTGDPTYVDYVKSHPEDREDGIQGINFVQLIKYDDFSLLINALSEPHDWTWSQVFFNDYVFAGDNLFKYFNVPNNPLMIGIMACTDPTTAQEIIPVIEAADREGLKELEYVPSV